MLNRGGAGRLGAALLLLALAALCYLPALSAEFIWDDDDYLLANKNLRVADGLARIWLEPRTSPQYYPLVHTAFWVERRLWGFNPRGYHAVNILLHAADALVLWSVLRLLAVPGAWLAAAIFCVHPVHVESVAWVAERKNVLSGLLYLASLRVYLGGAPGGGLAGPAAAGGRLRWTAAYALFVLALLAKTVAASLPVAILLALWWKRGRLTRADLVPLLPFFAAGAALGLTTAWLEKTHVGARGETWDLEPAERLLIAGRALWFYLGKLAWPHPLSFNYPRWAVDPAAWWQWLFPAGCAAAAAALWAARGRIGRGPLTAILFFAAALFPALGFVDVYPFLFSWVADHFQYLASIGPIALAASGVALLGRRLPRGGGAALGVAVIAVFGALTHARAGVFRDRESLWEDTVRKNPASWLAHNNLSMLAEDRGDFAAAERHARQAAALNPGNAMFVNNIGTALMQQGRLDEALEQFARALTLDPRHAAAESNRAEVFYRQGRFEEALAHFEAAVRLDPAMPAAHNNLATVLAEAGRGEEAVRHYAEAVRLNPDYALAHYNLGVTLFALGRPGEALEQYTLALSSEARWARPGGKLRVPSAEEARRWRLGTFVFGGEGWGIDFASVHNNIGNTLLALGRNAEAADHLAEAISLRPGFAEAHYNLGIALAGTGRLAEAADSYRRAIALSPRQPDAWNNLGVVLDDLGRADEAVLAWREALRLQPTHAAARANLGAALPGREHGRR